MIRQLRSFTVQREPNFAGGYLIAALAYAEKGRMEQALTAAKKADQMGSDATTKAIAAHVHAANGDGERAENFARRITRTKQPALCLRLRRYFRCKRPLSRRITPEADLCF